MVGKTKAATIRVKDVSGVELAKYGREALASGNIADAGDAYRKLCVEINELIKADATLSEMVEARTALGKEINSPENKRARIKARMEKLAAQLAESE